MHKSVNGFANVCARVEIDNTFNIYVSSMRHSCGSVVQ